MKGKIYIIDDDRDFADLMKSYFERREYSTEAYYTLQSGVAALDKEPHGIVFLDNNLPDGLGWSEVEQLHAKYPDIQFHLLSGFHYRNEAIFRNDAVRIWQKPISFDQLDRYFK